MRIKEISASLYPWDVADEGIEQILDNLQELTECNSVYLIGLMHQEKRPLTDFYYPHNPVRKTYVPEDSRVYWIPDNSFYKDSPIKPRGSDRGFLKGTDWLDVLVSAARKRGMKTGVEVSHTIVDEERASDECADSMQYDIFGRRLGSLICLNAPNAVEYTARLFEELATRYDVDYVQTCLRTFSPGPDRDRSTGRAESLLMTTLGGCFCDHCVAKAKARGLDLQQIRDDLRPVAEAIVGPNRTSAHELALLRASNTTPVSLLLERPSLFDWLRFRRDSVTGFFTVMHKRAHKARSNVDFRLNAFVTLEQELAGLDLRDLAPSVDSIRSSDYSEQTGDVERLKHKREWLHAVRRAVGDEKYVLSAIGVRPKATPEIIRQGVVVSTACGIDGITIGHYDGASFSNLRAVKEGLLMADARLDSEAEPHS